MIDTASVYLLVSYFSMVAAAISLWRTTRRYRHVSQLIREEGKHLKLLVIPDVFCKTCRYATNRTDPRQITCQINHNRSEQTARACGLYGDEDSK